jgi:hypothetical protein
MGERTLMPRAALYYPDWSVANPEFLFESLLYWDRLAVITPHGFTAHMPLRERSSEPELIEAVGALNEAFVSGVPPDEQQQQAVHERLRALFENKPPEWCRPENLTPEREAHFLLWKFSSETMELLTDIGWILDDEKDRDDLRMRTVDVVVYNILLGALAAECSSTSLPPITHDPGSFRASCNTLLLELGASSGLSAQASPLSKGDEDSAFTLCSIARLGSSKRKVGAKDLKRLYALRMDDGFDAQRRAFQERVDGYIDALRAAPANERQLFADDWQLELERDRAGLKRELRRAGFRTIVDKEGVIALVLAGGAGTLLGPIGAAIGFSAAAARLLLSARQARRNALEQHWSSWLFALEKPRLALW